MRIAATCLLLQAFACAPARAQEARTVHIVVPAPAGGSLDASARLFALRMAVLTGEPHVVENRPGGNTAIGAEWVMRAPADGRTLLFTGASIASNAWMFKGGFSPLDGLQPVVQLSSERYVLVAAAASGIASLADLQRPPPGRGWNCAAVPGATLLACEQLKERLGGASVTVPYAGLGPALTALQGGHVDLMFANGDAVTRLLESGRVRVLALSTPQFTHQAGMAAAGLPLMSEAWPGFLMEGAYGVLAPLHTPAAQVRRINRDFNQALAEPEVAGRMHEAGQDPVGGTPEHYQSTLRRLRDRYGELARRLGLAARP